MSPDDPRRPFVFVLQQNFGPQLAAGRLVYANNPEDLTTRLKPIFFIGIGKSHLITGPYELAGEVEYHPSDEPAMARMDEVDPVYGVWQELKISCPYQITFRPLVPVEYGVRWEKLCTAFGLDIHGWRSLIQVSLTGDQIKELADNLTRLNSKT